MPKQKTHKGLAKRVKVTATGKVIHKKTNAGHLMSGKPGKQRRRYRETGQLTGADARRIKEKLGK